MSTHALRQLARDCDFQDVNAATYKHELTRDAFFNGINSNATRQRLLEDDNLDLIAVVKKAQMLNRAQKQSGSYIVKTPHMAATITGNEWDELQMSSLSQTALAKMTSSGNKRNAFSAERIFIRAEEKIAQPKIQSVAMVASLGIFNVCVRAKIGKSLPCLLTM